MQRLAVLLLVTVFPLAACSADDSAAPTAAVTDSAATTSPAPRQPQPTRVAQATPPSAAASSQFEAGKDYRVLTPAQPTSSPPDQIEVAEVFMYSCVHCFNFESFVNEWEANKPDNVNFIRIPASFNPMARFHTKVYYTVETMGLHDELHEAIFKEYHVNKNRLDNESKLRKFLTGQGVDAEAFISTMKSFAVDTKVRKADTLARRYQISSVPTIVINGKYVTQASMTRSFPRLRDVMNELVLRETRESS